MEVYSDSFLHRFWAHVDKSGECWLWTGTPTTDGYGKIDQNRRWFRTHRVAWNIAYGPIPAGKFVCHSCDVRLRVNPHHLWLGTNAENLADMTAKGRKPRGPNVRTGRIARGEDHGMVRFSDEDARAILAARGIESARVLAERYSTEVHTIYNVWRRRFRFSFLA